MTNLSSLSKAQLGAGATALLAVVGVALAYLQTPFVLLIVDGILIVAISIWTVRKLQLIHKVLVAITHQAREVRRGDFERRVVFLGIHGDMRELIDEFNGVLDVTDAYLREAMLAMKAASEGRYYRTIRHGGLLGAYLQSAKGINAAIDDMSKRHAMDDIAVADFSRVVTDAERGQLDTRLESNRYAGPYRQLAEGMNLLMATVGRGLAETGHVLSAMAQADLSQRVTGEFAGAFEKLKNDSNTVADRLVDIMGQLRLTSRGVKIATSEILAGANDLSERTTKQAATIEETSAAIEQLAHTVVENAKQANQAHEEARNASRTAEQGGEAVRAANQAMERISASSAKISNIIGLIDDIAFQTNLLALNASVEAARAGEAGKGFAVVAVEVRRLAQSAAEASSDVKALIEESGKEVGEGSRLVASAAEKLAQMLQAVQHNAAQMEAIARESKEQASAIEEVSIAVRQMDEMTQHNAALVEQTNAAIEQTEARASELDRIVDVFTIGDSKAQKRVA